MNINTYELVLDDGTKHGALRLKESLAYKRECLSEPSQVAEMIREVFHTDEMADEFAYIIAFNSRMKVLGVFEMVKHFCNTCQE